MIVRGTCKFEANDRTKHKMVVAYYQDLSIAERVEVEAEGDGEGNGEGDSATVLPNILLMLRKPIKPLRRNQMNESAARAALA